MADLVKFKKGTTMAPAVGSRDAGTFYVNLTDGILSLENQDWYTGGEGFVDAEITVTSNTLSLTFTKADGSTVDVPVITGIDGSATTTTIAGNGDIQVDVVLAPDMGLKVDSGSNGLAVALSTDTGNALKFGTDGGLFVLPSLNVENGETVALSFNSTTDNLTAEVITSATPNNAVALSANASGLTVGLTLGANTSTVALAQDTTGLTANVILDSAQGNTVALSSATGLKAALNITTSTTNTVALNQGANGLYGDVTLDANGALTAAGGNGVAILIDPSTANAVAANDSGVLLSVGANGLSAELMWGSF